MGQRVLRESTHASFLAGVERPLREIPHALVFIV